MAPSNRCSNVEPSTPEKMERDWRRVQADVYKALKARLAECGEGDEE